LVEAGISILGEAEAEAETDASATRWHQPKHLIPSAKPGGAQPVHAYTYCHMLVYAVNENENNMDHVHLGRRLVLHLYRLARKKEVWTRLESYRK
jgi:hypothetical protein